MTATTITPVVNRAVGGANSVMTATWTGIGDSDNGSNAAIGMADWADRSLQVAGTFAGATVTVQGSNDGANWATLRDTNQNPLTLTSADIRQINELTLYLRLTSGSGGGTANINAVLFGHRINALQW